MLPVDAVILIKSKVSNAPTKSNVINIPTDAAGVGSAPHPDGWVDRAIGEAAVVPEGSFAARDSLTGLNANSFEDKSIISIYFVSIVTGLSINDCC